MNPMTNVKNITKLNEIELSTGSIHKKSWHDMYKDSAWIFIGGLEYGLTEGDVLAVFSQYGEIVNINLIRDKKTGKSKGYCFLCYANQKSTVLAVDNFNGIKLCSRTIRVDHVANYKPPKESERDDEVTKLLKTEGCAPQVVQRMESNSEVPDAKSKKKSKKEKKEKKKKKKKKRSDASDSEREATAPEVEVKKEKHDPGYDKYDTSSNRTRDPKRSHKDRNLENSKGESSRSHENYRSREDNHYHIKDNAIDKSKVKVKIEKESRWRENPERDNDVPSSSSKTHKRKRHTLSSDEHSDGYRESRKHKEGRVEPKRHSDHKRKYKDAKSSSSSSSDDGSSSQSSSEEDERRSYQNRSSRKDEYKIHAEKRPIREESRDHSYDRSENSVFKLSKNRSSDKPEKHSEHKSRTWYRRDHSDDSHHSNSRNHHESKRKK